MNQDQSVKLLFVRWGREFNDPVTTPSDIEIYCKRIAKYNFTLEEIAAGIERYAETFEYGQRRNWATLLKCVNEIRNAGINIMPAGVAADLFVDHYNCWRGMLENTGYDLISEHYFEETVRRLGSGIGQEEPKYARLKFIQVYESLVDYEMSIEGQSTKRLSAGILERELLADGNNQAVTDINRVAKKLGA